MGIETTLKNSNNDLGYFRDFWAIFDPKMHCKSLRVFSAFLGQISGYPQGAVAMGVGWKKIIDLSSDAQTSFSPAGSRLGPSEGSKPDRDQNVYNPPKRVIFGPPGLSSQEDTRIYK